jgi:hypothetical protein
MRIPALAACVALLGLAPAAAAEPSSDKSVQLEACHDLSTGYSPDQVMGIVEALYGLTHNQAAIAVEHAAAYQCRDLAG